MEDTKQPDLTAELVHLTRFDADIAKLRDDCQGVNARKDYEQARVTIRKLVTLRTTIEKTRKTLNEDALKYQRNVNMIAKRLIADVHGIEDPLQASKDAVDEERETARRAEAEAAQKVIEEAARLKAQAEQKDREDLIAARKAQQDAEAESLKAEAEQLRKEREAYEAEMRAHREEQARKLREEEIKQKAERDRLAEVNRKLEAERAEIAKQKQAIEDAQRLEEAKAREAENERIAKAQYEAEKAAMQKRVEEDKAKEAERLEALQPDRKKLADFAAKINAFYTKKPALKTEEAKEVLAMVCNDLGTIAHELEIRLEAWEGK